MRATDLCYLDASELATKLRTREVSSAHACHDSIGRSRDIATSDGMAGGDIRELLNGSIVASMSSWNGGSNAGSITPLLHTAR
jgi:hypothetical protein